jgi:hypothetical protein
MHSPWPSDPITNYVCSPLNYVFGSCEWKKYFTTELPGLTPNALHVVMPRSEMTISSTSAKQPPIIDGNHNSSSPPRSALKFATPIQNSSKFCLPDSALTLTCPPRPHQPLPTHLPPTCDQPNLRWMGPSPTGLDHHPMIRPTMELHV